MKSSKKVAPSRSTQISPIGMCSAATRSHSGLGNKAYIHLSVSFIQMLKAATPVVTMVIMIAFGSTAHCSRRYP